VSTVSVVEVLDVGTGVQSVDRAVTTLEILARRGTAGPSEVAADLGVHKTTAFRLLAALESRGLVEQTRERGKYQLGLGLLRLASMVPGRLDIVGQARSVCTRLAHQFGETVNIAVLRDHFVINLDQARGPAAIAAQNWVGQLTPLHATSSGKVLLAHRSPTEVDALLKAAGLTRYTPHTVTVRKALRGQLDRAALSGFAVTIEEYEVGLNAVAAPVRDYTGTVVAAISVSGPAYRLPADRLPELAPALITGADEVSANLGFYPPES
jgi:DNA-binding IclR family transcriptional regulator